MSYRLAVLPFALAFALVAGPRPRAAQAADLLLTGGTVVTMDAAFRVVETAPWPCRASGSWPWDGARASRPLPAPRGRSTPRAGSSCPAWSTPTPTCPMTLLRGVADDVELMVWLTKYIWPAEAAHVTPEFVTWGTRLAAWEMIRTGTTTFADMYFYEDQVAEAAKEAGLRGFCAATVMDLPVPGLKNADEGLRAAEAFLKKWTGDPLIVPAVGPHAAYTVGPGDAAARQGARRPLPGAADDPRRREPERDEDGQARSTGRPRSPTSTGSASWARTSRSPTRSG